MNEWVREKFEGFMCWRGETERMSVRFIPELGGKMISLYDKRTNREWLWRSPKPLGNRGYGSAFGDGDESGWDEMFPGITACAYPYAPWQGRRVPDHGEVWSLPWQAERTGGGLKCAVSGRTFPYVLEKHCMFVSAGVLRMDYRLFNCADDPFAFIWAAHPLLRVQEGMRFHPPDGMDEVTVSHSVSGRLGQFGDARPWPRAGAEAGEVDLSAIGAEGGPTAEKYYFNGMLRHGGASVSIPATGEGLTFHFPPDKVRFLGVWDNAGGYKGYRHFAIEPATGFLDDLGYAAAAGKCEVLPPRGECRWFLETEVN